MPEGTEEMKNLYLLLAIVGAIIPYWFFIPFIQAEGLDIRRFVSALFVNGAAGGFSADLLLASFVFWIFMFQKVKESNGPKPYLFIVLNLTIGLCCALPAYLYAREMITQTLNVASRPQMEKHPSRFGDSHGRK